MQHHWDTIRSKTQYAVRFVTLLLNIDSDFDEVGRLQTFLPWDILDDLSDFVKGTSYLETYDGIVYDVPEDLYEIHGIAMSLDVPFHMGLVLPELAGPTKLASIRNSFLIHSKVLCCDFYGVNCVTTIGHLFLYGCRSLTALNIPYMPSLNRLGNYFLWCCKQLTVFDTRGLSSLTQIGRWFMAYCTSLTSIDTSGLHNVK
eukprot:PhF_6_TR16022/c0_g1_i1/m.25132